LRLNTSGVFTLTATTGNTSGFVTFFVPVSPVTDNSLYFPPYYSTFQPLAVNNNYLDPIFGSTITRMSNATISPDVAAGSGFLRFISTEYSTMSPFNQGNSLILALHFSNFGLYNRSGEFIKNLPLEVNASSEPRWSRTSPNILYFVYRNQLKQRCHSM
jgi:hypothetical protein